MRAYGMRPSMSETEGGTAVEREDLEPLSTVSERFLVQLFWSVVSLDDDMFRLAEPGWMPRYPRVKE